MLKLLSIKKEKMLKIRLARVGKKKKPVYRIVISEHTKDMYGNHLEILGTYNPHTKEIVLKEDRIKHWISNGAQCSDVVNNLLIKEDVITGEKGKAVMISKKRKVKLDEKKVSKEEKVEEPVEEEKKDTSEEKKEETEEVKEVKEEKKEEKVEEPTEDKKEEN